jgi:hypothetical protein
VFRTLFAVQIGGTPEEEVSLSLLDYILNQDDMGGLASNSHFEGVTLVGAGAIGNAFLWTLARSGATGEFTVVDPELVDDTNLQRYVLTDVYSPGRSKVENARERFAGTGLDATTFAGSWAELVDSQRPFKAELVVTALDTGADRCAVQASLPKATLNAWTQSGDLGVSRHAFLLTQRNEIGGREIVDIEGLRRTAAVDMAFLQPAIAALNSGDPKRLSLFDDLMYGARYKALQSLLGIDDGLTEEDMNAHSSEFDDVEHAITAFQGTRA